MDELNTAPSAVALKACPFCGASPWPDLQNGNEIPGDYGPNGGRSFKLVWCNTCGASGAEKETETEAIAAWNTRAALSAMPLGMNDTNAVVDLIADAITDSFGPDWAPFDAAHHVMQWLENEGLQIVATAAKIEPATATSMEVLR